MNPRTYSFARFLLLTCGLVVLFTACSLAPSSPSKQQQVATKQPVILGAPYCQPPSPVTSTPQGLLEVRGTTKGTTELWALLFPPLVSKQEVKIVWRMTGSGDMQIMAQGPDGKSVRPDWLTFHTGSNWPRPGAEWGTGFTLPVAGCWDFHVHRDDAVGDVWLVVK